MVSDVFCGSERRKRICEDAQVVSVIWNCMMVVKRYILANSTLVAVSDVQGEAGRRITDKEPSKNMKHSDARWAGVTCSFHTWPMGMQRMATSVRMFGTALPTKDALRLMHFPAIRGNQAFLIGSHWKMLTQLMAMTQPMVMKPRM